MSVWLHRIGVWLAARPLLRFMVGVVALLPACFLAWYYLGTLLAAPAVMLADALLAMWLPDVVTETRLQGTDFLVLTAFGEDRGIVRAAADAGNQLAYPVDSRTLSYSIPFFAALTFATPGAGALGRLAWGLLALWALLAAGLVCTTLKNLMLGLGSVFLAQPSIPPADAIALAYQFSVLMVPPLAPVVLWAWGARDSSTLAALLPAASSGGRSAARARTP